MKQGQLIKKTEFCNLVYKKLQSKGYDIQLIHIIKVINILIDEIKALLLKGKTFIIWDFGRFRLERAKPKPFYNLKTGQIEMPRRIRNKLRFTLMEKMRQRLIKNLNIEETFRENNNEKTK